MSLQRVYKYKLTLDDWVSIAMPEGAVPLFVDVQLGSPYIWARVAIDAPPVIHHFRIAGTGHDLGSNVGRYIGTFLLADGALVFHVFTEQAAAEFAPGVLRLTTGIGSAA